MEGKTNKKTANVLRKLNTLIEKDVSKITGILLLILLVVLIINVGMVSFNNFSLIKKAGEIKEANKPAEIQLVTIKTEDCPACFDIDLIVDSVKEKNVKVLEEETLSYNDERARQLISEYGINKLPSLLIFGEIDKISLSGFNNINDALVFTDLKPLYLSTEGEIIGEVELINIIDSSCDKCISLSSIADSLGEAEVKITDYKNIEYNSAEGKELISKFGITKVPALLISEEIDYYDISQQLAQIAEKKQGYYALHSTFPPYRNLTTNKIEGLVSLILLDDNSCTSCYDVSVNKQILQGLGVFIDKENTYDIGSNEGKQLISKYNIEKVPIIILSSEADVYASFINAWEQVGSVENDGWFIMRNPELVGTAKNLITGEIIKTGGGN